MATMIGLNPTRNYVRLPESPERLFGDVLTGPPVWRRRARAAPAVSNPALDAYVTDGDIVVQAAFPGVEPENVSITLQDDTLTLAAELPLRIENVEYAFAERPHGRVSRTLTLNVPVDADKAEARFENGLLTLTLPKAEVVRPKTIAVTAK